LGYTTILVVEAIAMRAGILMAIQAGIKDIIIEGDNDRYSSSMGRD